MHPGKEYPASRLPQSRRLRRSSGAPSLATFSSASRLPQSRRLRLPAPSTARTPTDCRLTIAAVAATAAPAVSDQRNGTKARLTIAAVAATAAFLQLLAFFSRRAASRLPQSRRLRQLCLKWLARCLSPPHDCRSRGDCGIPWRVALALQDDAASRLPQSRRLRRCAAWRTIGGFNRLTIAAVAATAAGSRFIRSDCGGPPHDCRSRGDCGLIASFLVMGAGARLTIAAVAATAAWCLCAHFRKNFPASRLPQSRRLRPKKRGRNSSNMSSASRLPQSRRLRLFAGLPSTGEMTPPHDCRSRGDCGTQTS